MVENIKVNTVPSLTWNWMKMNYDLVSLYDGYKEIQAEVSEKILGIDFQKDSLDLSNFANSIAIQKKESGIFNIANPKLDAEEFAPGYKNKLHLEKKSNSVESQNTTENHPICKLVNDTVKNAQNIVISESNSKPLVLNLCADGNYISSQNILVKKGTTSQIIFLYSKGNTVSNSIIRTRVFLEENACVNIIKVQLLGKEDTQLDDTVFICQDNSKAFFAQIELGGKHVDSGLHVSLEGYKSSFESNVAYLCGNNQYLDMNHIVYHYGKKSECNMKVNGTLKDNAVKTYRGTIDFKNGCSGSKGNEMEETLLLNPSVINKSLPIILCDEEDVEGEHGSTIGKLSNDILFYMESRGISQSQAEIIMSKAKIQAVADRISDENIQKQIEDFIDNQNK